MSLVFSLIALGIWFYVGVTILARNKFSIGRIDYGLMWITLICSILANIVG